MIDIPIGIMGGHNGSLASVINKPATTLQKKHVCYDTGANRLTIHT